MEHYDCKNLSAALKLTTVLALKEFLISTMLRDSLEKDWQHDHKFSKSQTNVTNNNIKILISHSCRVSIKTKTH